MKTESKEEIINSIKQYMYDESIETSETKTKIIAKPYFISVIKKVYENNFGEENTSGKNLSEKKTKTEIENYDHNIDMYKENYNHNIDMYRKNEGNNKQNYNHNIDMYRENEKNNRENYNHNVEDYSKTKNMENAADKINTINDSSENETTKEKVKNEYVLIAGDFDKLNELNEKYGFEEGNKSMKKVLEKIIKVLEKDLGEKQKLLACRIGRRRVCILNRQNRAQPTKWRKNTKQNKRNTKRTIKKRRKHTQTKNNTKLWILWSSKLVRGKLRTHW